MRTYAFVATILAQILLGFLPGSAVAQSFTESWTVTGLENPESVVSDFARNVLYVSNVGGDMTAKDGNGYISKIAPKDGKIIEAKWVEGLDGPKGLALVGDTLFVADIDQLVEIDVTKGEIVKRYPAAGSKFLNDVAAAPNGDVYVSDTFTNTIWRLHDGAFSAWLESEALLGPNGLHVSGGTLLVAAWGIDDAAGGNKAGRVLQLNLDDKSIRPFGGGQSIGHLDGIEPWTDGTYLVTEYMGAALVLVSPQAAPKTLLSLGKGAADLTVLEAGKAIVIPIASENRLTAYRVQ